MNFEMLELANETGKYRSREVRYFKGPWRRVQAEIPEFEIRPFKDSPDGPANEFLRTVVRMPRSRAESPIPVGVVSPSYTLAPHRVVIEKCIQGIQEAGIPTEDLQAEVGLSELDEWMNLRLYFPESYHFEPNPGDSMQLRLECTNSVDGSSRLVVQMSWLRLICSNGMTIEESIVPLREIHNEHMDIDRIPAAIGTALAAVNLDRKRLGRLVRSRFNREALIAWVDGPVAKEWGPVAAARVFHICQEGCDAELRTPFAKGLPSKKEMKTLEPVPGSPNPARTLFDVSQALAWVATCRNNSEERLDWQRQVSVLIDQLSKAS